MAFKAALPEHSQYSLSEWLHYEGDARPPPRAQGCSVPRAAPCPSRRPKCPLPCLLLGLLGEKYLNLNSPFSLSSVFVFFCLCYFLSFSLLLYLNSLFLSVCVFLICLCTCSSFFPAFSFSFSEEGGSGLLYYWCEEDKVFDRV